MPYKNGNTVWNATIWTGDMISSLKENFPNKTNKQLADMLNVRLTVLRNKTRELGLRKMEQEYWTDDQVKFLKANYKTKGDVEIAEYFQKICPKKKRWDKRHIRKKRGYLKLDRTPEEIFAIASKNSSPGGNSFTIDKNSSSKNMHPVWVAQRIAWRDKDMQQELIKHPELIEAGRGLIKLKRIIKQKTKDAKAAI